MSCPSEKRRHPRAEIRWPVVFQSPKGPVRGETLNISAGGAFIRCRKPLKLNHVFGLIISVPGLDRAVKIIAEVVWSNIYGPDDAVTPRGMGVQFKSISDRDRHFVTKKVTEYLELERIRTEAETIEISPDSNEK